MDTTSDRTETLELLLTPEMKQALSVAAEAANASLPDFVLESALARARGGDVNRPYWMVDPETFAAFQAALDAPPRVLPNLKRLLERRAPWE